MNAASVLGGGLTGTPFFIDWGCSWYASFSLLSWQPGSLSAAGALPDTAGIGKLRLHWDGPFSVIMIKLEVRDRMPQPQRVHAQAGAQRLPRRPVADAVQPDGER